MGGEVHEPRHPFAYMEDCWILLGMMGAGKSSVGRALAEVEGREFLDTDTLLTQKLGRSIPQIFQIYGEDTFRDHEHAILRDLSPTPIVLATGGGIVKRPENWLELRRLGTTIYLDASEETLLERLASGRKRRPLLEEDDWENRVRRLLSERLPLYRQADISVPVDGVEISEAAERVLNAIRNRV